MADVFVTQRPTSFPRTHSNIFIPLIWSNLSLKLPDVSDSSPAGLRPCLSAVSCWPGVTELFAAGKNQDLYSYCGYQK